MSVRIAIAGGWRFIRAVTGLRWLAERKPAPIILGYHGIQKDRTSNGDDVGFISLPEFQRHLSFLRKHRQIVSLDQIQAPNCDPRSVSITFDDGFAETVDLVAHEMGSTPWTLNVPVGLVGGSRTLWSHEMRLIARHHLEKMKACIVDSGLPASHHVDDWIRVFLKSSREKRRDFFDQLILKIGAQKYADIIATERQYQIIGPAQLRELASNGVVIGAHGDQHEALNEAMTADALDSEIVSARQTLERMIGTAVSIFAFPFGVESGAAQEKIRSAGYRQVLTSRYGSVRAQTKEEGISWLPRIPGEWSVDVLRAVLAKAS